MLLKWVLLQWPSLSQLQGCYKNKNTGCFTIVFHWILVLGFSCLLWRVCKDGLSTSVFGGRFCFRSCFKYCDIFFFFFSCRLSWSHIFGCFKNGPSFRRLGCFRFHPSGLISTSGLSRIVVGDSFKTASVGRRLCLWNFGYWRKSISLLAAKVSVHKVLQSCQLKKTWIFEEKNWQSNKTDKTLLQKILRTWEEQQSRSFSSGKTTKKRFA